MKDKNENEFGEQVDSLIRELETSKSARDRELAKQAKGMRFHQKEFDKRMVNLQESLDYLRICIKYIVFDLEATRRENVYLQRLLEEEFEEFEDDDEELIG